MNREMLNRGLSALAVQVPGPTGHDAAAWAGLEEDLVRYLRELELWNPRLGLVEASADEMVSRHLLDCLAALPVLLPRIDRLAAGRPGAIAPGVVLADIGSGAGLPGLVLSLALRRLWTGRFTMTLVEKQQRRVGFLLNAKALLGLDQVEVAQENLEQTGRRAEGGFDLVTARAFRPLEPVILRELRRLLRPEGCLFLYKGRRERIGEELAAAGLDGHGGVELAALAVPFLDEERHILVIPKA